MHVKNPWLADKGEGCEVFNILFLVAFTELAFCWAGFPHNKYTTPVQFWLITLITSSVNFCQPHCACELALLYSTVRLAFKRNTPCSAHLVRSPWFGFLKLRALSAYKFLYMFLSEGGGATGFMTLKHRPCAWPGWW